MTDKTELLPCPFCGGENVNTSYKDTFSGDFRRGVYCADCCGGIYPYYDTKAEAIAAWNTRAERGTLTAEQVREAIEANSWAETSSVREFNDSSWQAIADELNARAERTCKFVSNKGSDYPPACSVCGYELGIYDCEWFEDGTYGYDGNYCPNCGAKVVDE